MEKVYIYGAGKYLKENIHIIEKHYLVEYLIDANAKGSYNGIPIVSKEELYNLEKRKIIIMIHDRNTCMEIYDELTCEYQYNGDEIVLGMNVFNHTRIESGVLKVGIMGCGMIAEDMAFTLIHMNKDVILYACASRNINKAKRFSVKYGIEKYYGSYLEMVREDDLDLIYIATPCSEHYKNMRLCIDNNKNILCEKSFTTNLENTLEIIEDACKKGILVCEGIAMLYQPLTVRILDVLNKGVIGEIISVDARIIYGLQSMRVLDPELGGGALFELGIYAINIISMVMGSDFSSISVACRKSQSGVDEFFSALFNYSDKRTALISAGINAAENSNALIIGSLGYIEIDDIVHPKSVKVYNRKGKALQKYDAPKSDLPFIYEVQGCLDAIKNNDIEVKECSHKSIIERMNIIDTLYKRMQT